MKTLIIVGVVLGLAGPVSAGPLLDAAYLAAAKQRLAVAQQGPGETPERDYRKGSTRKWLEWLGIIGGGLTAATYTETCFGDFCKREWHAPAGGTGLSLLSAGLISKALPDPQ